MRLIKPNQQEIVKVTRLFLKLWNDRNLQLSLTGELITEQGLTGAIMIVFLRSYWNLLYIVRNKSFYMQAPNYKSCTFPCNKIKKFTNAQ